MQRPVQVVLRAAEEFVMDGRRDLAGALIGFCLGLAVGWLSWSGDSRAVHQWADSLQGRDAVLVIAVETQGNLDAVRRAVSKDRIVASSKTGFAIHPQRLVVTSLESAGELLTMAGWQDRPLEIVDVGRRLREDDVADKQLESIASLMNKPTLTRGEAYRLLRSM